jgi:aldehyde:ferredoxin oxidoreductase
MYGMDTISCGATIAWAMDCYEAGILTGADTGGLPIQFGDAAMMVRLVEMIGRREGIGDLLAEGSVRAAERIGRGAAERVAAVKGMELPAHTARIKRSLSLIYGVNPFGADHQSSEHDPSYGLYPERMSRIGLTAPQPVEAMNEEKVRFALRTQLLYSCLDTVNLCQFVFGPAWQLYGPDDLVQAVQQITGWDVTLEELMQVGARRLNLLRAFNAREGIGREQDTLPKKLQQALVGGPTAGHSVPLEEFERAKDWYYEQVGWDPETGTPTRATLEALELGWVADALGLA